MVRVECWACGRPLEAPDGAALRAAMADHLRGAHGDESPDEAAIDAWIARHGGRTDVPVGVVTAGRVLAGAAAVSFTLLALLRPAEPRTAELLLYGGLAAFAGALVCALTLLGRLLQR